MFWKGLPLTSIRFVARERKELLAEVKMLTLALSQFRSSLVNVMVASAPLEAREKMEPGDNVRKMKEDGLWRSVTSLGENVAPTITSENDRDKVPMLMSIMAFSRTGAVWS